MQQCYFSKQRLPLWCPAIDSLLVQGCTAVDTLTQMLACTNDAFNIFGCHSGLFLYLIDESSLCAWGHFDWVPSSRQSSDSPTLSLFVDCLLYCILESLKSPSNAF